MSKVTDPGFNPSGSADVAAIKEGGIALEKIIEDCAPSSRCRSIALTHLETALMFAVKAAATGE